ncbi:hypothetical protein Agub_g1413, partial [Astrephomene gubernaculifera]
LLPNLQCLLRLLVVLVRQHMGGRLDMGFGSQQLAAGKGLFTALLRTLLDPHLSTALYPDITTALQALTDPWDDTQWRRIAEDAAQYAADAGPSHRAALHLILSVQGCGERLRSWQQTAALLLLRKEVPQSVSISTSAAA